MNVFPSCPLCLSNLEQTLEAAFPISTLVTGFGLQVVNYR